MIWRPRPAEIETKPVRRSLANDRGERLLERGERAASDEKKGVEHGHARGVLAPLCRQRFNGRFERERSEHVEHFARNVRADLQHLIATFALQLALEQISLPGIRLACLTLEGAKSGAQRPNVPREDI